MKMRELRPGDLILYPMNQSSFQHTAIFVGTGYAVHADADSNFVIREPIEDTERYCPRILDHLEYRFRAHVYRCKKEMLAQKAALYPQRFARTNANDAGATKLGLNRARGVTQELHYLKARPTSEKRGTRKVCLRAGYRPRWTTSRMTIRRSNLTRYTGHSSAQSVAAKLMTNSQETTGQPARRSSSLVIKRQRST